MHSNKLKRAFCGFAAVLALGAETEAAHADIQNPPIRVTSITESGSSGVSLVTPALGSAYTAGTLIVVFNALAGIGGSPSLTSEIDSKSNTYTCGSQYGTGANHIQICYSMLTNALSSSDTITSTWSSSTGSKGIIVEAMSGEASSPVGIVGAGSTFNAAQPTAVPSQAITAPPSQMVFGVLLWGLATSSAVESSGFTTTGSDATYANTLHLHVGYEDFTSSGSASYAPTITNSETGVNNQYGFVAGSSSAPTVVCERSLMGVGC
jgi:hypothetical protein